MTTKLITILASDEAVMTAYVQINKAEAVGTDAPGVNRRFQFVDDKKAAEPWLGSVQASLAAFYPGAEFHTEASLNTRVLDILIKQGKRLVLKSGAVVTPDEKARLDQAVTDAQGRLDAAKDNLKAAEDEGVEAAAALVADAQLAFDQAQLAAE